MNKQLVMNISELQGLCDESVEESLILEFKPCNELKIDTEYRDKKREVQRRTREVILEELTKDVSALLNATGGTIIYGLLEKRSRANKLDTKNAFNSKNTQDNVPPERVTEWLRFNINPPPAINVYSILQDQEDPESSWFLVVDVPQGDTAYMAWDKRFYKRVGTTVQRMEQYEVVDVMNRIRGADLDLKLNMKETNANRENWTRLDLRVSITSKNYIASEYGALKLTFAYPIELVDRIVRLIFRNSFVESTGFYLDGYEGRPRAKSINIRWGASTGNVVFPGDWHSFNNNRIPIEVLDIAHLGNPVYIFSAELFTINRLPKKLLYSILYDKSEEFFYPIEISPANYQKVIDDYWKTFHEASNFFKN